MTRGRETTGRSALGRAISAAAAAVLVVGIGVVAPSVHAAPGPAVSAPTLSAPAGDIAVPDAGPAGAEWAAAVDGSQQYPEVAIERDVPITMSDGVVLKADVYRPAGPDGAATAEAHPVIVSLTPYTKLVSALAEAVFSIPELTEPLEQLVRSIDFAGANARGAGEVLDAIAGGGIRSFSVDRDLVRSGYTQVVVDVRGTGFSQGTWQVFQDREQRDTVEVIEWAAAQPYSNGRVGMTGVSYSAINQLQAAAENPEALGAIFPVEPGADLLADVVAPGGGLGIGFMPAWLGAVNTMKWVPDVASMLRGDFDERWLADRIADPATFFDLLGAALFTPTVDDVPDSLAEILDGESSLRRDLLLDASTIGVPTMIYGGWFDLFTHSQPRIYNAIPLESGTKQLIMGETYHLNPGSSFGQAGTPPRLDVLQRAWFDHWLKGMDNGIEQWGPLTLKQIGGDWVTRDQFPQAGVDHQRLYLSNAPSGTAGHAAADGSLTLDPGADGRMTIAPGLSTLCSRDAAQQTIGVFAMIDACGKDSRIAEQAALTFTSAPVQEPTQISGWTALHLNTVLDATDGYWAATLNDVAPDGQSTVIASGQLTSSLRAIDEADSLYSASGDVVSPSYSLTLDSRRPIDPGTPTELDVGLNPTQAVLKPGHRLRVDVYAANLPKGMLLGPLLRESELKPQHLQLDPERPSFVTVPVSRPIG